MLPMDADIHQMDQPKIKEERVTSSINYHLIYSKAGILASIVKIPKKEIQIQNYAQLRRLPEDEEKIDDIISTLGNNGKAALFLHHEKRLRKMGDEIRVVHPLKFIGYIFSKPDLKQHMAVVFDDYFKRINFVKDYAQTMDIFDLKNQLVMYVYDFSKEVDVSPDKIMPFINNKDWEGLLRFLISN